MRMITEDFCGEFLLAAGLFSPNLLRCSILLKATDGRKVSVCNLYRAVIGRVEPIQRWRPAVADASRTPLRAKISQILLDYLA